MSSASSQRKFYIIYVVANECEPPSVLDISTSNYWRETPLCPYGVVALKREIIPAVAKGDAEDSEKRFGETGFYRRREYVAYRVLSPTTAELVWRKRRGMVKGRWVTASDKNQPW